MDQNELRNRYLKPEREEDQGPKMTRYEAEEMWDLIESQQLICYSDGKIKLESLLKRLYPKAETDRLCSLLDSHTMDYPRAAKKYFETTMFAPERPTPRNWPPRSGRGC